MAYIIINSSPFHLAYPAPTTVAPRPRMSCCLSGSFARMDDVKAHPMYQEVDWDRLKAKLVPAPWVPDAPAPFPEPETPNVNDVYTGDQVNTARSTLK